MRRRMFVPDPLTVTPPDIAQRGRILGRGTPGIVDPGDPFGGGAPEGFGDTQRTLLAFPPEIYPIPDATEFRRRAFFNSGGAGTIEPSGLVLQLPANQIGVIRLFGIGLLNMLATTDVGWSLWIDNNVVSGYEDVGFFPGNVPRVTDTEGDLLIRVPQGARISVKFRNGDGAVYDAGANYYGWSYSPESAARWNGEGVGEV